MSCIQSNRHLCRLQESLIVLIFNKIVSLMGGSNSKIEIRHVPLEEIKGTSPIETAKFCPPFRSFQSQNLQFNGRQMQGKVEVIEPMPQTFQVCEDVYQDLQEAFENKTKQIQLEAVIFDDQYVDMKTFLGKDNGREISLQFRPFHSFSTHAFNQILYELHMNDIIKKINCENLNTVKDRYIIQTGLELTGEEFPNSQILQIQPVATNLSEIIKYRRQNNWDWSVSQFNTLAYDLTNAVVSLHRAQISHNDIRPVNVFFSTEKNCYQIGCFGNSVKCEENVSNRVRASTFFGAPELEHHSEIDLQKADIYSLGMTLLCAFYLCEPVDRKNSSAYNRKFQQKYSIMGIIRQMIKTIERRTNLQVLLKKIPHGNGQNSKKMKSLIQSLRYKNSPKELKLVRTKKAMSKAYKKLGLWNEWKQKFYEAFELEENSLDEFKKATSLYELAKIESCRGEELMASSNSKTASKIFRELGYTAVENGNINQSLNFFNQAIECSKFYENQNDLDTAKSLQGLSLVHAEKGDYEVSKPLIKEAGMIVLKTQGRDSLDYNQIRMSEAKIQSDFGEFQSSDNILHESLMTAENKARVNEFLGLKLKAQVLHEIGRNKMMQASYQENQNSKMIYLREAEQRINQASLLNQQNHPLAFAGNVQTLGEINLRKQQYTNAKQQFINAQKIRKDLFEMTNKKGGHIDKQKADNLCHIAACENGSKQYAQALTCYNEAINIYRSVYGSDHNKYSAIAIGNMNKVYLNMEEKGKAKQCLKLATEILEDLLGKDDPDYQHFKSLLEILDE